MNHFIRTTEGFADTCRRSRRPYIQKINGHIAFLLFIGLSLFLIKGCSEKTDPLGENDITTSADIPPEGGILQISDQLGNNITVTFPDGALTETTNITLSAAANDPNLPVEERRLPVFGIRPADLNLYKPVEIKVEYHTAVNEIEKVALYRVRSDDWLMPLADHTCSAGSRTVTATTVFAGDFAEGRMSLEQINTQIDRLVTAMDISWEGITPGRKNTECDTRIHKAIWDDWKETTAAFLKFFEMRMLLGYYDNLEPGQNTFEEEVELLCENVMSKGVNQVLDQCQPEDPCDRDYTHTIAEMMQNMMLLGCEGSSAYSRLSQRFEEMLINCSSYLTITSDLSIEGGEMVVSTGGVVGLTISQGSGTTVQVTGNGVLAVSGSVEGETCYGVISGTTTASVTGTRDGDYTYTLTLSLAQMAVLTTICPDFTYEVPLTGGDSRQVVLSNGNGYHVVIEEPVDNGSFTMDITLENPYIDMPGK
ncbi:MAG: hypothetical protein ACP5D1_12760 [Bacteroidales bacterium]